ncbi:MAG: SGNH/GDSL hydrolase family protein [Bacteroidales bacterium]|nr:SGNH/GDSL hydrolase family protein [Bacteroidales bacterium]
MKILLFLFSLLFSLPAQSQLVWWNPEKADFSVLEGQAWPGETERFYDRLPLRAKEKVRKPVWGLSKDAAGLALRFHSNASRIVVRYGVSGNLALPHMSATGVSGVDMYAKDSQGRWMWVKGRWDFRNRDTIVYTFSGIRPNDLYHTMGREYRLYLPLYNHVKWLEIGVPDTTLFEPLPVRPEKPIVVYGTSIAQGACASRPGMAWSNLLERTLDRPVINLSFSGNGMLEKELLDLLTEIDAKLYVLDCLPNMIAPRFSNEQVRERIIASVAALQSEHPQTPILLVEHDGYSDGIIQPEREKSYADINKVMEKTFAKLKTMGKQNLFLLTREEIAQNINTMVDGTHGSDAGMLHYANAYEKTIRTILQEPKGILGTTMPVTQYREPENYDWEKRHQKILKENRDNPPRIVFLGNSIIHYWGGVQGCHFQRGSESWDKYLSSKRVKNMGFGWDRIENVLWRVNHDELDGYDARQVILLIGTNNLHLNNDKEVLAGLSLLIRDIRLHQPKADVLVLGILPRRNMEKRISLLNLQIARLAGDFNVHYADIGSVLLDDNGSINPAAFIKDGLHPNAEGYERLGKQLVPLLK